MGDQPGVGRHALSAAVTMVLLAVLVSAVPQRDAAATPSDANVATGWSYAVRVDPRVLPPSSKAFGKTYAEWSAQWWKWALEVPAEGNHPLIADGQMDCGVGQAGKVWFLGGTYAPADATATPGQADRSCDVPTGTALFFPIFNVICSEITGDGTSEAQFRDCAGQLADQFTNLSATIDGVEIRNLHRYRTPSPLFTFGPLPDPNIVGAPACVTQPCPLGAPGTTAGTAVADGYYLLLAPLSRGDHTIEFAGEIFSPFQFSLDISYDVTVREARRSPRPGT